MIEKIRGILLKTIRHNDRSNIVTLFTRQKGCVSFISSAGSSTKSGRMRNAILSPLAIIDADVNFLAGRDLQLLGKVATPHPWRNIYFDPMRGALALFIADFLNSLLKSREPDPDMWDFLAHSLYILDTTHSGLPNFHITFLIRLLHFAGIEPDIPSYIPGSWFDLREGGFSQLRPLHPDLIPPQEAKAIPFLARMNYRTMPLFRLNGLSRRRLLSLLMRYYAIHLPVKESLPSIQVLQELFA